MICLVPAAQRLPAGCQEEKAPAEPSRLARGPDGCWGAQGTTSCTSTAAETLEKDLGSPEPVPNPTLLCRSRIREHY